jgi:hypothetical protein
MRAKEQSEPKREGGKREKMSERVAELDQESSTVTPDAAVDRPSRAPLDQNDRAPKEFERSRTPNRRLTEQELRELLNVKERELTERQRLKADSRKLRLGNLSAKESDIQTNHTDSANERESANTAGSDFDEARSRVSEPKKPPTEQQLSETLSRGVRELKEAETRRRPNGPEQTLDLDFD